MRALAEANAPVPGRLGLTGDTLVLERACDVAIATRLPERPPAVLPHGDVWMGNGIATDRERALARGR